MAMPSLLGLSDGNSSTVDYLLDDFNVTNATMINGTFKLPVERSWVYWLPGPFICAFGIICNTINLAVLSQRVLKDSPYTYLTALAISDLTLLTTSFIHLVTSNESYTFLKAFYDVYVFFSFGNVFFNVSVWLVVALTIERVLFVTHPMTFHPSKKIARVCCVFIYSICAIINIPRFFCYKIIQRNDNYYPKGTAFRESQYYYRISWAHALIITFIPISILLVTNLVLIRALRKAAKERAALHSNKERESRMEQARLTRTLVAVVVVFIICTFPSAFVEDPIAYSLFGGDRTWNDYLRSPGNQLFIYISNLLVFLNSSLNFVLYCAFNRKFRQATKTLFSKICPFCRTLGSEIVSKFSSHSTHSSYVIQQRTRSKRTSSAV